MPRHDTGPADPDDTVMNDVPVWDAPDMWVRGYGLGRRRWNESGLPGLDQRLRLGCDTVLDGCDGSLKVTAHGESLAFEGCTVGTLDVSDAHLKTLRGMNTRIGRTVINRTSIDGIDADGMNVDTLECVHTTASTGCVSWVTGGTWTVDESTFRDVEFAGLKIDHVSMHDVRFEYCAFESVDMSGLMAQYVTFVGCTMDRITFPTGGIVTCTRCVIRQQGLLPETWTDDGCIWRIR